MRECTKCKSNEYTNKSLLMMINECGHPLCKNCVETLFARNSGNCPTCQRMLKKNEFREQIYDDPLIDKETAIRKKMRKVFNLKRDDFPTLREFNDYLERMETLIYNLVFETDLAETQAEIDEFKKRNAEAIEKNRKRLDEDQQWVASHLKEEEHMKHRLRTRRQEDAKENEKSTGVDPKAIIEELKNSKDDAESILDRERKRQIEKLMQEKAEAEKEKRRKKEVMFRKRQSEQMSFSAHHRLTGQKYAYKPLDLPINGPPLPSLEEIEASYLVHMKIASPHRIAGGYTSSLGCERALFEARNDLLSF